MTTRNPIDRSGNFILLVEHLQAGKPAGPLSYVLESPFFCCKTTLVGFPQNLQVKFLAHPKIPGTHQWSYFSCQLLLVLRLSKNLGKEMLDKLLLSLCMVIDMESHTFTLCGYQRQWEVTGASTQCVMVRSAETHKMLHLGKPGLVAAVE